jgi:hypothetical protein
VARSWSAKLALFQAAINRLSPFYPDAAAVQAGRLVLSGMRRRVKRGASSHLRRL